MSNFKHIQQFDTSDPEKLGRQLSELEDNIDGALNKVSAAAMKLPNIRVFVAAFPRTITDARPDEQLSLDTSQADAKVVFPAPTPANFGRRFVLVKRAAANNIVCSCPDPTVPFNGGAAPTLSAVGVKVFYCDATGYYS